MKKVIILYSTGGMGHKKAAMALRDAFSEKGDKVTVKNVDTLDYGDGFYKFIYLKLYVFFMTRARWLWGILYYISDLGPVGKLLEKIRPAFELDNLPGLDDMLLKERPDAIITTHFVLPGIASVLKKRKDFNSRLYVVITDYGPHSFWISKDIDRFFVGAESIVPEMVKRGVPAGKISPTGIPTSPEFTGEFNVAELRAEYGIEEGKKTIFMLSGGFGVGPMEDMLLSLCSCKCDIQVITVCGHNKVVHDNIDALKSKLNYPVILFGFSDKIAELMAVSDLMITKAGGISVTEALNMSLPMILFASIPGQETWNERLLVKTGAAEKAASIKEIPELVNRLLLSEDAYASVKEGIAELRRPRAAHDIVGEVIKELGEE